MGYGALYLRNAIDNCSVGNTTIGYGDTVSGTNLTGGIVGEASCRITECNTVGVSVNGGSATVNYTGGIVGTGGAAISNCHNSGGQIHSGISEEVNYTGGIAGRCEGYIYGCENSSDLYYYGTRSYAGGIVGYLDGTMHTCTHRGFTMVGENGQIFASWKGGLAGDWYAGPLQVYDCCKNVGTPSEPVNNISVLPKCTESH